MKDKFPYLGKDVLITQDMCDLNEHMNVIYYAKIFEDEFPSVSYTHLRAHETLR